MASPDTSADGINSLAKTEHHNDGKSKKVTLRQLIPGTGEWVNVSAVDNGDGTYSLKTSGAGGVAAYSDSGGTDRKGLVDADRHVQTDVLTLPATAATSAKQDTGNTSLSNIEADIESIIKAEDAQHASGDKGVMSLGVIRTSDIDGVTSVDDGDYVPMRFTASGAQLVKATPSHTFDEFNSTTGWTALNNDAGNVATSTDHLSGTASITFDKLDGSANTLYAIIQKTVSSTDISKLFQGSSFLMGFVKLPTLSELDSVVIRLGTNSTNYNEWRFGADGLTTGRWNPIRIPLGQSIESTGNGWDASAITYIAVGTRHTQESSTMTGIKWDNLMFVSGVATSADIEAETTITTGDINLKEINGSSVTVEAGTASSGTQRVILAQDSPAIGTDGDTGPNQVMSVGGTDTDGKIQELRTDSDGHAQTDVLSSALPTGASTLAEQQTQTTRLTSIRDAVEVIDDWDESDRAKVNLIAGQAGVDGGSGATTSKTLRVAPATDSGIATESTLTSINGKLPDFSGTWGYSAGTSGTVNLTGSKRVVQITATALEAAGTITINGGDTITLPYGGTDKVSTGITIAPLANLTDPTVVFTGTDAYFIEYVV